MEQRELFIVRGCLVGRKKCGCPTCREAGIYDHGYLQMNEMVIAGSEREALERVEGKALKQLKGCVKVRWVHGPFVLTEPWGEERANRWRRLINQTVRVWEAVIEAHEATLNWMLREKGDGDFVVIVREKDGKENRGS